MHPHCAPGHQRPRQQGLFESQGTVTTCSTSPGPLSATMTWMHPPSMIQETLPHRQPSLLPKSFPSSLNHPHTRNVRWATSSSQSKQNQKKARRLPPLPRTPTDATRVRSIPAGTQTTHREEPLHRFLPQPTTHLNPRNQVPLPHLE